jgi:tRNA pseudouridine13 synthase
MKLKSLPEDFRVEEISDVQPSRGPFSLYRLDKMGLGTPEAIQYILHTWQLKRNDLNYGGMKDRHADTTQYLTIFQGPKSGMSDKSFQLTYLGQCPRPFHAKNIVGNRFDICLRRIDAEERNRLDQRCQWIAKSGIVNYFDDQRFGSIGHSGDLIGVAWCLCDYERALYLALAEPNPHDRPREKEQKQILRDYWGDWNKCKAMLDRSHRRSVVTYLCDHATDFKRALALVRQDLRGIYISAFQSFVWNRWLSDLIQSHSEPTETEFIESKCGPLAIPLNAAKVTINAVPVQRLQLPLPSARQHTWPEGSLPTLEKLLTRWNLDVRQLRLKYPRDTFFSRGDRSAWLWPKGFASEWATDPLNPGYDRLRIQFELPRGAYATMVVRYLFQESSMVESLMENETDELESENIEAPPRVETESERSIEPNEPRSNES